MRGEKHFSSGGTNRLVAEQFFTHANLLAFIFCEAQKILMRTGLLSSNSKSEEILRAGEKKKSKLIMKHFLVVRLPQNVLDSSSLQAPSRSNVLGANDVMKASA